MRTAISSRAATLVIVFALPWTAAAGDAGWERLHDALRAPLAALAIRDSTPGDAGCRATARGGAHPAVFVIGLVGGFTSASSPASGVVVANRRLSDEACRQAGVTALTYRNLRWRRAATEVIRLAAAEHSARRRQPIIIVHGHSWGASAIHGFAERLERAGLEITLAIYVDTVAWRNPRVPRNVHYAVNFYQRAGVLRGLPLWGKRKLFADDRDATTVLGSYRLRPLAGRGPLRMSVPERLLSKQHLLLARDPRLHGYLTEAVNIALRVAREPEGE